MNRFDNSLLVENGLNESVGGSFRKREQRKSNLKNFHLRKMKKKRSFSTPEEVKFPNIFGRTDGGFTNSSPTLPRIQVGRKKELSFRNTKNEKEHIFHSLRIVNRSFPKEFNKPYPLSRQGSGKTPKKGTLIKSTPTKSHSKKRKKLKNIVVKKKKNENNGNGDQNKRTFPPPPNKLAILPPTIHLKSPTPLSPTQEEQKCEEQNEPFLLTPTSIKKKKRRKRRKTKDFFNDFDDHLEGMDYIENTNIIDTKPCIFKFDPSKIQIFSSSKKKKSKKKKKKKIQIKRVHFAIRKMNCNNNKNNNKKKKKERKRRREYYWTFMEMDYYEPKNLFFIFIDVPFNQNFFYYFLVNKKYKCLDRPSKNKEKTIVQFFSPPSLIFSSCNRKKKKDDNEKKKVQKKKKKKENKKVLEIEQFCNCLKLQRNHYLLNEKKSNEIQEEIQEEQEDFDDEDEDECWNQNPIYWGIEEKVIEIPNLLNFGFSFYSQIDNFNHSVLTHLFFLNVPNAHHHQQREQQQKFHHIGIQFEVFGIEIRPRKEEILKYFKEKTQIWRIKNFPLYPPSTILLFSMKLSDTNKEEDIKNKERFSNTEKGEQGEEIKKKTKNTKPTSARKRRKSGKEKRKAVEIQYNNVMTPREKKMSPRKRRNSSFFKKKKKKDSSSPSKKKKKRRRSHNISFSSSPPRKPTVYSSLRY